MKNIQAKIRDYRSFDGYLFSDKRALHYVHQNEANWDVNTLNGKVGVLGLSKLIPDYHHHEVLQTFSTNGVRQAVLDGDFKIFEILREKLLFLKNVNLIVSTFLCAHRPSIFPIWDERRQFIQECEMENVGFTYLALKQKIDSFKIENELDDIDYFKFNKLIWYCE